VAKGAKGLLELLHWRKGAGRAVLVEENVCWIHFIWGKAGILVSQHFGDKAGIKGLGEQSSSDAAQGEGSQAHDRNLCGEA
jgi:hypothetical protein